MSDRYLHDKKYADLVMFLIFINLNVVLVNKNLKCLHCQGRDKCHLHNTKLKMQKKIKFQY